MSIDSALIRSRIAGEEEEHEIYELSLHNLELHSSLGLSHCKRLRVLDLSFNQLRAIEGLEELGDLRELRVYANEIAHVGGLSACLKLQGLLLHDNRLGQAKLTDGGLTGLAALATLRIDNNPRLGPEGVAELQLEHLPALTELDASSTRLGNARALALLPAVEILRLQRNELNDLTAVGGLQSLQELDLGHNELRGAALASLRGLAALSLLYLEGNRIETLEGLPPLPNLLELHLGCNRLAVLPPLASAAPPAGGTKGEKPERPARSPERDALGSSSHHGAFAREAFQGGRGKGASAKGAARGRGGAFGSASGIVKGSAQRPSSGGAAPPPASLQRLLPRLEVLDLSDNTLFDADALVGLARRSLPSLAELRLRGNPLCADESLVRSLAERLGERVPLVLDDFSLTEVLASGAHPDAAEQRAKVAGARPGTATRRPGTAQRLGTAGRPGTASRPAIAAAIRPGTGTKRVAAANGGGGEGGAGEGIPLVRPPDTRRGVVVPMKSVEDIEAKAEALRSRIASMRSHAVAATSAAANAASAGSMVDASFAGYGGEGSHTALIETNTGDGVYADEDEAHASLALQMAMGTGTTMGYGIGNASLLGGKGEGKDGKGWSHTPSTGAAAAAKPPPKPPRSPSSPSRPSPPKSPRPLPPAAQQSPRQLPPAEAGLEAVLAQQEALMAARLGGAGPGGAAARPPNPSAHRGRMADAYSFSLKTASSSDVAAAASADRPRTPRTLAQQVVVPSPAEAAANAAAEVAAEEAAEAAEAAEGALPFYDPAGGAGGVSPRDALCLGAAADAEDGGQALAEINFVNDGEAADAEAAVGARTAAATTKTPYASMEDEYGCGAGYSSWRLPPAQAPMPPTGRQPARPNGALRPGSASRGGALLPSRPGSARDAARSRPGSARATHSMVR